MLCPAWMPLLLRAFSAAIFACVLAVSFTPAFAQPLDIYPVRQVSGAPSLSLNGKWKFKYLAGTQIGADSSFNTIDFTDAGWTSIIVPGHWELQGFAEPKYAKVDEGL